MTEQIMVGATMTQRAGHDYGIYGYSSSAMQSGHAGAYTIGVQPPEFGRRQRSLQMCDRCKVEHMSVAASPSLDSIALSELMSAISEVRIAYAGHSLIISRPSQPGSLFAVALPERRQHMFQLTAAAATTISSMALLMLHRKSNAAPDIPFYEELEATPIPEDARVNAFSMRVLKAAWKSQLTDEIW